MPVAGDRLQDSIHLEMASLSYVKPSPATTGSRMISCETENKYKADVSRKAQMSTPSPHTSQHEDTPRGLIHCRQKHQDRLKHDAANYPCSCTPTLAPTAV